MDDDPHKARFMAYLSLFTFAMLTLVTADNFLQLYFGWEGVGLCSYLLIGFWYKKPSANAAAIKAFIVNRVGDFGFAIGIFLNRKNVIIILMSIELILVAVNINLVSFSIYLQDLTGQVFAMFILTVAAAEAAVGLAIIVAYYKNKGSIHVERISSLKG